MKGINFRPWKIKAIAENPDRDWQTRRLSGLEEINQEPDSWWLVASFDDDTLFRFGNNKSDRDLMVKPRYQVGETVYIKEAWAVHEYYDGRKPSELPDGITVECKLLPNATLTEGNQHREIRKGERGRWRSPLFMPQKFARYFIKITGVTPQRLQEISHKDIRNEGISLLEAKHIMPSFHSAFRELWDSINKAYPFDSNPFVWVYEFESIQGG